MPKLKLTLQQVKENYKREVAQRTNHRIKALTQTTTSRENVEEDNCAEIEVFPCEVHDTLHNMNKKMNVLICIVAILVVYFCAVSLYRTSSYAT